MFILQKLLLSAKSKDNVKVSKKTLVLCRVILV